MRYIYLSLILGILFPLTAQTVIFSDNMTNFPTNWTLSGTTGHHWTRSSARFFSSSHSAKCTPNASYSNNVDVYMERSISLSGYSSATLTFYIWQNTEANYDFVYLQYFTTSWITAWSRSGSFQSWQQISVSIPTNATRIRFWFRSDNSVTYEGVYIDDVVLSATSAPATKEWTIMVFMNADNDLEAYGIQDFNEMEAGGGSNSHRNVLVQIDRIPGYDNSNGDWTGCRRYYVTADNNSTTINSTLIQDLGEVDMGSPTTLVQFVQWARQNYPANKYFLVLWDHGDGWYFANQPDGAVLFRGFSNDATSGTAIDVANGELNSALSQIKSVLGKNIDLIGWDACLMGMWEVMDITKNYANILVSSEEIEHAVGWFYTNFLNSLNSNPTMSALDLGIAVVNGTSGQPTLAVTDLSQIAALTTRIDAFADQLIQARAQGHSSTIQTARNNTRQFYLSAHIDLYDFADKISNSTSLPTSLRDAANAVKNAILNATKFYKNSSDYSMCRGVAIYHPSSSSGYNTSYNNLPIASTRWDEYLRGESGSTIDYTVSQVTYSWVSTSTATGITGDDQSRNFTLPFAFNFYGTNYTSVNICSNGFLSFTSTSTAHTPAAIPNTSAPNALIAPFWRDLNPSAGGTITYYSGSDRFIVTWNAVRNYANSNSQTFQVILYPNGVIVFQYNSVTNDVTTTRGIENQTGTSGRTISAPSNGTAWRFTPNRVSAPGGGDGEVRLENNLFKDKMVACYPNPASGVPIQFVYKLESVSNVRIDIYNSLGRVVQVINEGIRKPGVYTAVWNYGNLPAGIYFYRFITKEEEFSEKIILMK